MKDFFNFFMMTVIAFIKCKNLNPNPVPKIKSPFVMTLDQITNSRMKMCIILNKFTSNLLFLKFNAKSE